jgi:hypothetical protein
MISGVMFRSTSLEEKSAKRMEDLIVGVQPVVYSPRARPSCKGYCAINTIHSSVSVPDRRSDSFSFAVLPQFE